MFATIFDRTLGILVSRYTLVTPSEVRINQFRGDVTTILLIASEALMFIAPTTDKLFDVRNCPGSTTIRSIHTKCNTLYETLALVTSPLQYLYKVVN